MRSDESARNSETLRRRLWLLLLLSVCLLTVLGFRAFHLQIKMKEQFQLRSEQNTRRDISIPAPRGNIYDRNGVLLAQNYPSLDLLFFAVKQEMNDETAANLAKLLKVSVADIKQRLKSNFELPYQPILLQEDVGFDVASKVEENRDAYQGAFIGAAPRRHYYHSDAMFHILGYVREISKQELDKRKEIGYLPGDLIGKEGIERQYENVLRGTHGKRTVEVNAKGKLVQILGETPPRAGRDIWLTIDIRLQRKLFDLLKELSETEDFTTDPRKYKGTPSAGVVLDPRTGDVLAMASYPIPSNVSLFSKPMSAKQWNSFVTDPNKPLINRAIKGTYPPGSTFKVIAATAGLADGQITPDSKLFCGGAFYLGRYFRCWKPSGHGWINVITAIYVSCDVFFYRLGDRMGIDHLAKYAKLMGLGSATGIDLPDERDGIFPSPEWKMKTRGAAWYGGETINTVIGQGDVLSTPLQMAYAVSAIANRGWHFRPHLLLNADEEPPFTSEKVEITGVPKNVFETVVKGMALSVQIGTSTRARVEGLKVCGKTGTSQVLSSGTAQTYHSRQLHAWFVSFASADDPQMVVVIIGERSGYGGRWSAPVAQKIYKAALEYGIIKPLPKADSSPVPRG